MDRQHTKSGVLAVILVLLVSLGTLPGVAAAETRAGGTIVVESGETVNGLQVVGGTVIVRGTVDGNVEGLAGSIVVEEGGTVTGNVQAATGTLTIDGRVDGNVQAAAGTARIGETGTVGGNFEVGSGHVTVAGSVGGDAQIGADTLVIAESGTIDGSLTYDAEEFVNSGQVAGTVTLDESLGAGWGALFDVGFPDWAGTLWGLAMNLVLGALLLTFVPRFTESVRSRATTPEDTVRTGLLGFVALVGVPIALVAVAITIVGIPFAIVGFLLYGLSLWVGFVYGGYILGGGLLALVGGDANRWAMLGVGLIALALVGLVPVLGGIVTFLTLVVGLGAVTVALVRWRRGDRDRETGEMAAEDSDDTAAV